MVFLMVENVIMATVICVDRTSKRVDDFERMKVREDTHTHTFHDSTKHIESEFISSDLSGLVEQKQRRQQMPIGTQRSKFFLVAVVVFVCSIVAYSFRPCFSNMC